MKSTTILSTLGCMLLSLTVTAQCIRCNSLDLAMKAPKQVKSLIINSAVQGTILEEFPIEIIQCENIETLYLTDQPIRSIPVDIGKLKKLKSLSFAGCSLTAIPDEIFTLKNLQECILLDNQFSEAEKKSITQRFKQSLPQMKLLL